MLKTLAEIAIGIGMFFGSLVGIHQAQAPMQPAQSFGAFNPTGGGTYRLGQSVGTSDTTIKLSSFTEPVSGIKYTMTYLNASVGYGTVSPQSSISEFISFSGITQNTDGSAILTGVVRGLSRSPAGTASNCTVASTTLAQGHAGQSIFILSNSPCFQQEYAVKQNNENISGIWNFQSLPTTTLTCSSPTQFCPKFYIDAGLNAGAATSTFTNIGIVWLASLAQQAAGTASSSSGAPLVLTSKYASSTWNPSGANVVPVTNGSNVLDANFIATTSAYNWTGLHSFAATTTIATTTVASTTVTNGLNVGANATTTFNGGGIVGIIDYQSFVGSGTWTKPTNVTGNEVVRVQMWGSGGGGGGASNNTSSAGGGGGGGAFVQQDFKASDLTSTVTVTVPAGGAGGVGAASGGSPAAVTFGSYLSANSGAGGTGGSGSAGGNGAGGAAGTGYATSVVGQSGGASTVIATGGPGGGAGAAGASSGGTGGTNSIYTIGVGGAGNSTSNSNGNPATGNASGGGGAGSNGNTETGGNGSIGIVRVWTIK